VEQYLAMVEVLGEGGELVPLLWSPGHLVDGRAILVIDETEARLWVWLGRGTSIVQRTTALRQARFIMHNGIHVEDRQVGAKCTEFVEVQGSLNQPSAASLVELLKKYPKSNDYLIGIEKEDSFKTFEEEFQARADVVRQTIAPEPMIHAPKVRRRILSYQEQLACKVVFAVTDLYGHAALTPVGPSEFEVTASRLLLRFFCQGDDIYFSHVRAATQDDIDGFARCFGQQPQLGPNGDQVIDPNLQGMERETAPKPAPEPAETLKPASVVDAMRKQLSQLGAPTREEPSGSTTRPGKAETVEDKSAQDSRQKRKPTSDAKTGPDEYGLFDGS
jgi:hypothetical protein